MKVLIIDDSQFMRESLKQIISGYTQDIFEAGDLETAIQSFRDNQPDVVFLDIMMEETDTGVSILKQINNERKQTKVIVVSSLDMSNKLVQNALQMNIDGYVKKPFSKEKVEKYLQ